MTTTDPQPPLRILLIDDEPFALKVLERQLANLGFPGVTACERAGDALMQLERDPASAQIVFCDLQMPRMDGVEFVRHLVRIGYAGALVLVSGEDSRILQTVHRLAKGHRLNVLGVLCKPVSPGSLRKIMEGSLARTAATSQPARKEYGPQELAKAIAFGELVNYYQPKVVLGTGEVIGAETLVRWRHPEDGLVFPDQFIGVAEETGLIDNLTRAVLTGALGQARRWQDEGFALEIAVNVSMENLALLDFPDWVERAALDAGHPLPGLMLEVTESRLMRDALAPLEILSRLRLKHVGLSIDDFGTGHSSLAQLRDIPFTELKVDHSFVHGACSDSSLRAILEASLGMARQLGLRTVAEGVEDREDWEFLRECACDLAQGYFIARPMPAEQLVAWIGEWESRKGELICRS